MSDKMKFNIAIEWDDEGYYVGRLTSEPAQYLYSCDSPTVFGVIGGLAQLIEGDE
jgi:hypothetical protein